jgi:ATP-binding protein involved in chromosome partitioning
MSSVKNLPGVKCVLAVASGKGGVGKSTVSSNLALALSQMGKKVGFLDADIYGPSLPTMMGVFEKPNVSPEKKIIPIFRHGVWCMSIGFLLPDSSSPIIWRGPMLHTALRQLIFEVDWSFSGGLDVLVIDLPPGTGDVQLTLAQQIQIDGAVIVSTPQEISLIDVRKGILMFQKVGVPILGMIENMSSFVCPHCHHETAIFGEKGVEKEGEGRNIPVLDSIPLDVALREQSDQGIPLVLWNPEHPISLMYKRIAETILQRLKVGE